MSVCCWIRTVRNFLLLLISIVLTENAENCPLCCIYRSHDGRLNCTWTGDTHTQYTLYLKSLKYKTFDPVLNFTSSLGQNWLLIPRKDLLQYEQYHLRLQGGDTEKDYYFTYGDDAEKVLIEPPVLSPVKVLEENIVEVHWLYPAGVSHLHVDLRYRKLGENDWIRVDPDDLGHGIYEIYELEKSSVYEVQIRYLPDESQKMGSSWSTPLTFQTAEEAPTGSLDVWTNLKMNGSVTLLWKVPKNHKRSHLWNYTVTYVHDGKSCSEESSCREDLRPCEVHLPADSIHMCVSAHNTRGTGPPTCAASLCSDEKPLDLEIRAWSNVNRSVTVWWDEPANPPCENHTYLVEWTELTQAGNVTMNWARSQVANQSLTLQGNLAPHVPHRISLFILCQYACDGPVSTILYSEEGVPLSSPNFSIRNLSSTDAFLSWDDISFWQRRGILTHYNVYVNSSTGSRHHTVFHRNISLSGLLPGTMYHTWITASTVAGEGPPGEVKAFHTTGPTPLVLNLLPVYIILIMLGVLVFIYSLRKWGRKCWMKIPSPKTSRTLAILYHPGYSNTWDPVQVLPNPPISAVEEVDVLPPPPTDCCQLPISVEEDVDPPSPSPAMYFWNCDESLEEDKEPSSAMNHCRSSFSQGEEEEGASASLPATINHCSSSGYEKHFMPTIEEVMGLCPGP